MGGKSHLGKSLQEGGCSMTVEQLEVPLSTKARNRKERRAKAKVSKRAQAAKHKTRCKLCGYPCDRDDATDCPCLLMQFGEP